MSCYKDAGLSPESSAAWLIGKKWRIEYYTGSENYTNYVLEFEDDWDVIANTNTENRLGKWAVYQSASGNILQLKYSQSLNGISNLSGDWIIVDQQMTTISLKNSNVEMQMQVIQ
jgi:hypothetical protein